MENQETEKPVAGVRISSSGQKLDKPTFELLESGDYEFKVVSAVIQNASERNPKGVPYIKVRLDTEVNGKKRVLFHNFFLTQTPWKNGKLAWKQTHQLLGFAKALGDDFDFMTVEVTTADGTQDIIYDPAEVKDWVNGKQGMTVKAHVKRRPATDNDKAAGYADDKNDLSYFIVGN